MTLARALRVIFAAVVVALLSRALQAEDGRRLLVRIEGAVVPSGRVLAVLVDETVVEPPTAAVALREGSAAPAVGRGIDIAAVDGQIVFIGEVVGIERLVLAGGERAIIVRAFDRLHRLNRSKQTRTFSGVSDADMARQLASNAGLHAKAVGPEASTPHSSVHQHEQTDLEFLRERAAAIGYDVFTDGITLHFEKRRFVPQMVVGCRPRDVHLRALLAWLAPPDEVREVHVRGWDPVKKEEIVGKARQTAIGLSRAAARIVPPAVPVDLGLVEGLHTAAAAHAAAEGVLAASTRQDLSAEMAVDGDAALRARSAVILDGVDRAFNGKYLVQGVSHRFHGGPSGRWQTLLRVLRDDRSVYLLPEVGDEVLVSFQHGDVDRPVVAGSLWNSPAPPDSSPCRQQDERDDAAGRP